MARCVVHLPKGGVVSPMGGAASRLRFLETIYMPKKSNLPVEINNYFREANILHGYVGEHLKKASETAFETGEKLSAAKDSIPHGRWEDECTRLFDGSLRSAQFYMTFTKNISALPKAQQTALLINEGTLNGAAKAARKAAKPAKVKPKTEPIPDPPESVDSDPFNEIPDEVFENVEVVDTIEEPEPEPPKKGTPPKQFDNSYWLKQWEQAIGPMVRLVDKLAGNVGQSKCKSHKAVQGYLNKATEEVERWMK